MQKLTRFACLASVVGLASFATAQQLPDNDAAPASPVVTNLAPAKGNGSYLALGDFVAPAGGGGLVGPGELTVGSIVGDTGCLGIEAVGGYYYISGRAVAGNRQLYQFDSSNGNFVANFQQLSQVGSSWGHRDLASDGTNLYGGEENGWFSTYSIGAGGALGAGANVIIAGAGTIRALARNTATPGNFYKGDFNAAIIEFNAGGIVNTFANPGRAYYGLATNPTDSNIVWGFAQNSTTSTTDLVNFTELDVSLGMQLTGVEFDGVYAGTGVQNIAGGTDLYEDPALDYPFYLFASLHQFTPDSVFLYDSGIVSGTPTTTFCTAKAGLVCGLPSISASGMSSATATSGFNINASPARACRNGVFVYSTGAQTAAVPFQGGTACQNQFRRAAPIDSGGTNPNCDGVFTIDFNSFMNSSWQNGGCVPNIGPQTNPHASLIAGATCRGFIWGRDTVATGSFVSNSIEWVIGN